MNSRQLIDMQSWKRREYYDFFSAMMNPYCGLTVEVEVTHLRVFAQEKGLSFNTCMMYAVLLASDEVEHFRYRIVDGQVYCYDHLGLSAVDLRDDKTMGYTHLVYRPTLEAFAQEVSREHQRICAATGLAFHPDAMIPNVIFFSALPYLRFSEMNHAAGFKADAGMPRISTGKFRKDGDRYWMPMSITFHHGFMDGYHVGQFVEAFERVDLHHR